MYIKLLISCFILTFVVACDTEKNKPVTSATKLPIQTKKYKFNECLVFGKISRESISFEEVDKLMSYITPKGILNAYKNNKFWFDVVSGGRFLEYYFFYDSNCEERVENTQRIMAKYFLSSSEFSGLKVQVKPISETDLPNDLARPVGRWLDK